MMTFEELMNYCIENNCSDIHITAGTNLAVRRNGDLVILDTIPTIEEAEQMIFAVLKDDEIDRVKRGSDLDIGGMINGIRIRGNIYHQRNNLAASIRILMPEIPTFEDLGLPSVIRELAESHQGMILVTGPTGSGKSTTLAAIVDYINKTAYKHVVTIEDPIEYLYSHDKAMIHQREIGKDVRSFSAALRSVLREDPDIILVGEMRDYETIQAAITAAETGHLVLSTLHTNSASQTIERIIGSCPSDIQDQIRVQFSNCVKGVISQQLLPTQDGMRRVLATEIMVGTIPIRTLIRENKITQIPGTILSSHKDGMHTFNEDLIRLIRNEEISKKVAMNATYDPVELGANLGINNTYSSSGF